MPWNCTLSIILKPAAHDLSYDPAKQAGRYRRGDIIDAYESNAVAELVGNDWRVVGGISSPRSGFIHIKNVPDIITLDKIKNKILGEVMMPGPYIHLVKIADWDDFVADNYGPFIDIPVAEIRNIEDYKVIGTALIPVRRAAWRIPASVIPAAMRTKLLTEKELTVTWTQVKPFVRKKIVNDRLNSSTDDEATELNEAEI